ncbi:hypothetical protein F5887DRAFT_1188831 [Amanita rubescens]|nr:hypothetical protein F5887DRAFT_1081617 [Amanita rubescens]KAF8338543.1 hypothetical protein F5887DRAFT_1077746 [Amanita rubescens]KAF8343742.1 hypothetical protein F5887DRAFT_1075625 [Amanita rubescens]KAF8345723.1 hypothetical protein F5887DRAFT_1188831 [Amanita rubescens]
MLFQSPKYGSSFTTNTNALLPPTLSKHQDAIEYAESVLGLVRFYRAQITGHAQGFLPPDLNSLTSSSCNFKGMFYYTNSRHFTYFPISYNNPYNGLSQVYNITHVLTPNTYSTRKPSTITPRFSCNLRHDLPHHIRTVQLCDRPRPTTSNGRHPN